MINAWSHLPNAHHIDWVMTSLKKTPESWKVSKDENWMTARVKAWDALLSVARYDVYIGTWNWFVPEYGRLLKAYPTAWGSIMALIVWDDCDHFLNMGYEKLKVWIVLSEDPRAILLFPMIYVKEQLKELESA